MTRAAGAAQPRGHGAVWLARAAFALLIAGAVAALFIAQALKREAPLIKDHSHPMAFPGPGHRFAHFKVRATLGGHVDVDVLTASGEAEVARIATHLRIHEYRSFHLTWNGRTTSGAPARPGLYVVRVHFDEYGRSVVVPKFVLTLRSAPS